jgi:hypothetical protein
MNLFNSKTSDQIVTEIHNEIDNAQEILLKQANELLGNVKIT